MKRKMNTFLKKLATILAFFLFFSNCQKEEIINSPNQKEQNDLFSDLKFSDLKKDQDFKLVESLIRLQKTTNNHKLKVSQFYKKSKTEKLKKAKNEEIKILKKNIKKIKNKNFVSYTFKLDLHDKEFPRSFYNLVVQNNNGKKEIFSLKYYPNKNWNPTQKFEGEVDVRRGVSSFSCTDGGGIQTHYRGTNIAKRNPCGNDEGGGSSGKFVKICQKKVVKIAVKCGHGRHNPGQNCKSDISMPYYTLQYKEVCHWEYKSSFGSIPNNNNDPNYNNNGNIGVGGNSNSNPTTNNNNDIKTSPIVHLLPEGAEFLPFHLNLNKQQTNFINWNSNSSLKNKLEVFVFDNKYSSEAKTFAKGQIELEILIQDSKRNWKPSTGTIANNPNLKYTHSDFDGVRGYFKMTDSSIIVTSSFEQTLTKSGNLTTKYRDTSGFDPNTKFYYIKLPNAEFWSEILFNPKNTADQLRTLFELAGKELGKSIGRYILPIEDIKILIDGKDFDGQKAARWKAAGGILLTVVPGGKVAGAGVKVFKTVDKIADGTKIWGAVAKAGNKTVTFGLKASGEAAQVLKNARKLAGKAKGVGVDIKGKWLRGTERNAGFFPKSIADKMRGKNYKSFREFREEFWKNVAVDPKLNKQFLNDPSSMNEMKLGRAPFANRSQQIGKKVKYELHHKTPINQGGSVYDVDNLVIVTPRYHKEILLPEYHKGYGY